MTTGSDIWASGNTADRRWRTVGTGLAAAGAAGGLWLLGSGWIVIQVASGLLAMMSVALFALAVWRRPRSFTVSAAGIELVDGGRRFGERQLVPWSAIAWFGTLSVWRSDDVRLAFERHGVHGRWPLPGGRLSISDAEPILDRVAGSVPGVDVSC